jgi:hypothetical protein
LLPLNVARLRQEIGAHVAANPVAAAGTPMHRFAANDNQESGEVGALAMP